MDKVIFRIEGSEVSGEKGKNILQIALESDIYIPHLCYYSTLKSSAVCRLCLVEVNGSILPSCRTIAQNGMEVKVRTPELDEARRGILELIMANHHLTCKGCQVSGHCSLQKVMAYVRPDRKRINRLKLPEKEAPLEDFGDVLRYDPNKCVLCGICVYTCEEIQHALNFLSRGFKAKVAFFGETSKCRSCYQCISRCPVGALVSQQN